MIQSEDSIPTTKFITSQKYSCRNYKSDHFPLPLHHEWSNRTTRSETPGKGGENRRDEEEEREPSWEDFDVSCLVSSDEREQNLLWSAPIKEKKNTQSSRDAERVSRGASSSDEGSRGTRIPRRVTLL